MADIYSVEKRSKVMAGVRSKNTAPEMAVRSALHRMGCRFRLHRADLPGKPDIVIPGKRICIFINGCFWHQHEGCAKAKLPSTNTGFWRSKLSANVDRDRRNYRALKKLGWDVGVVWECEAKGKADLPGILARLIRTRDTCYSLGDTDKRYRKNKVR